MFWHHTFLAAMAGLTLSPIVLGDDILPPGATPERLARGFQFTEGPLYDRNGGVLFTDIQRQDIIRYDIATKTTTTVDGRSGGANGLFFDNDGLLLTAEGNSGRVTRRSALDLSVVEDILADRWDDKRFNSPNDLVVDARGGIYFTDPDYNNRRSQPEGVYYRNSDGELSQILSGFRRPNGIILSPDGQRLYLALESQLQIMAYDVNLADGSLSNEIEFAKTNVDRDGNRLRGISNGPDGMTVDPAGNLYAAVQNEVWAWTPEGDRLFELRLPENPTNVAFGGDNGKTLFITARTSLYGIELNIVPEPSSFLLAIFGIMAMSGVRLGNRSKRMR